MDFLRRLFGVKPRVPQDEGKPETPPDETIAPDHKAVSGAALAEMVGSSDVSVEETPRVEDISAAPQALIETAPLEDPTAGATAPLKVDAGLIGATRQLPTPVEIDIISKSALVFGYSIDVGQVRTNNQDAIAATAVVMHCTDGHADFGLFTVADGMGGHLNGEKASAQVVSTVSRYIVEHIYLPLMQYGPHIGADGDTAARLRINEILIRALQEANTIIISEIPNSGTTATLAVIVGNVLHLAHIGDSRAYLINQRGIEQITRDHSLAQRLFEVGQLSREEMMTFPRRNELYKVLGFTDDVEPDVSSRRLPPGSYLLLCSDGLWGEMPDSIIQNVVLTSPTPRSACERLVELANERGGHDNISVIVVQIPGEA